MGSPQSSQGAASPARQSSSGSAGLEAVALGARPAHVVAGSRIAHMGAGRVLVERYDFARPSAPARLSLAVDARVQLIAEQEDSSQRAMEKQIHTDLKQRISELVAGRTEALRKELE